MLGAVLGSFLNVVAVDLMAVYKKHGLENKSEAVFIYNQLRSKEFWQHLASHRSSCDTCSTQLTPKELVPVVSYLWQKGHCNTCNTKFAPQHLYVELLAGFIFTGVFLKIFGSYAWLGTGFLLELAYLFVFFGLAIVLLLFDYKEMLVPNMLVYPMMVMALGLHVFDFQSVPDITIVQSIIGGLVLAVPLFLLWAVSQGRWMGMADSKIALVMGFMLGSFVGISSLALSFWLGALAGIILIATAKVRKQSEDGAGMGTAIPFGPFMILALWFSYLTTYSFFVII